MSKDEGMSKASVIASLALLIIAISIVQATLSTMSESLAYSRLQHSLNQRPEPPNLPILKAERLIAIQAINDADRVLQSSMINDSVRTEVNNLVAVAHNYLNQGNVGQALGAALKALAEAYAQLYAAKASSQGLNVVTKDLSRMYSSLVNKLTAFNKTVFRECSRRHSLSYIVSNLAYAQYFTDYAWRILKAGNYSLALLVKGNGSRTDVMIATRGYVLADRLLRLAKICLSMNDPWREPRLTAEEAAKYLISIASKTIDKTYNFVQPFTVGNRLLTIASELITSANDAVRSGRYAVASYYALMAYAYARAAGKLSNSLYESDYFNITISSGAVVAKRVESLNAYINAYRSSGAPIVGMLLLNSWSDIVSGDNNVVNCINAYCLHIGKVPLSSYDLVPAYIFYLRGEAIASVAANLSKLIAGAASETSAGNSG